MSEGALSHLISTLYSDDFFELKSQYRGSSSVSIDSLGIVKLMGVVMFPNPGRRSIFTVRIGEYVKAVAVYPGSHPCALDNIQQQIDDLAEQAYSGLTGSGE